MAEESGSRSGGTRRQIFLLVLAIVFIAFATGAFYYIQTTSERDRTWLSMARQFATDANDVAKAGRSQPPEFRTLDAQVENFDINVESLLQGDPEFGIQKLPESVQPAMQSLAVAWNSMKASIEKMLEGESNYLNASGAVIGVLEGTDATIADYETIAERLGARGAPGSQILLSAAQLVRLERLKAAARGLLTGAPDVQGRAQQMETLAREFTRVHQSLIPAFPADSAIDAAAERATTDFATVTESVATILDAVPAVNDLELASATLQGEVLNVIAASKNLEQAILDATGGQRGVWLQYGIFIAAGLALLSLIGFVYLFLRDVRRRQARSDAREARQQQAILELLDEITNLADGDLTVDVTVTEDFTGAIADSINYTVQNMRNLVGTLSDTSVEIAAAASSTQETARRMNAASERQAREITAAASSVTGMSQSLQEVASRAEKLAAEAKNSVQVAHNGAATVGRSIQGMSALREQIQDTSKRIKRLGESSQEIGNIIEFINDIAEQTNTLALNASIQAAMAGESGRGFAVVADEVQRLAERAGNATRQIETLVKTIQADTNEAIISMERSTANVVTGAKAAEEAGQALTNIESTSTQLARLMSEISVAAREQSAQGTKIAGTMQVVREIAVETAGSASTTAEAVGELGVLSEKLRESVSGFKLPEGA